MTLALAWGAIAIIAAVLVYRWRQRTWRLCVLVVGTSIALAVAVVLTGPYEPVLLGRAAKIVVATVVLTIVVILLVRRGLPQLASKHDRYSVAVVFGAISTMYLAVAGFLAATSDASIVADLPQVRTRDEFIELRDSPNPGALLLEARISRTMSDLEYPLVGVASYRCPAIGALRLPAAGEHLPARFLLDLPGGPPIVASGIESAAQAWDWPSSGDGSCVLRRGDSVVIRGDLRLGMGAGGPTSDTGLANVQTIAAGDIRSFLHGYVPAAERTGRAVLALAALNCGLAVTAACVGAVTYRRLAHTGTDSPPKITWRSGSR
ncbi:MAG: hypothetical protein AB7G47_11460 [Mycolicibacterium sp.]|uniref:hypothetical protein n=1 Tax=Mycolicibacterium sp. TaxID=2320850 RepID=UPI003D1467BC